MVQKTWTYSPEKLCPGCGETFPRKSFYVSRRTVHGLSTYCKVCSYERHNDWRLKNKHKAAEQAKRWRDRHPRAAKDHSLRARYGVPLGWYEQTLAKQAGKCACCGSNNPGGRGDFHIDHCHETNEIRGLLCHGCNIGIGQFKHDPEFLQLAIDYLARQPTVLSES